MPARRRDICLTCTIFTSTSHGANKRWPLTGCWLSGVYESDLRRWAEIRWQ